MTKNDQISEASDRKIVVAIYDYVARENSDISFQKDDRMKVIDDTDSTVWCRVLNLRNNEQGWVPQNYVFAEKSHKSEEYVLEYFLCIHVAKERKRCKIVHKKNRIWFR